MCTMAWFHIHYNSSRVKIITIKLISDEKDGTWTWSAHASNWPCRWELRLWIFKFPLVHSLASRFWTGACIEMFLNLLHASKLDPDMMTDVTSVIMSGSSLQELACSSCTQSTHAFLMTCLTNAHKDFSYCGHSCTFWHSLFSRADAEALKGARREKQPQHSTQTTVSSPSCFCLV